MEKELKRCPHCGNNVRFVIIQNGAAIVCEDKNCLAQMRVDFGTSDNKDAFIEKLISDWNSREPENMALNKAIRCVENYRDRIYEETQEEFDNHGSCCIDVLDEVLNRIRCFTRISYKS